MIQIFPDFDQTRKKTDLPSNPTFEDAINYILSFCPTTHPQYIRDAEKKGFVVFELDNGFKSVELFTNYCDRNNNTWRFKLTVHDIFQIAKELQSSNFFSRKDTKDLPFEQIQDIMAIIKKYDRQSQQK